MEYQEAVMKEGILSIDLGTMGVKVTLVSMNGEIQRSAYAEYPIISEQPGQAEQDPALWWKGIIDCIKELESHDVRLPKLVNAISICGQMHTHVYLDSEDNPIGPSITWLDQRSSEIIEEWNRDGRADRLFELTWNFPTTTYAAPQICWVKRHRPQVFAKTKSIMIAKDYIKYLLTGNKITDPSDASGTAVFDIRTNKWSPEALDLIGLDGHLLSDVMPSARIMGHITDRAGKETGLLEGTPVVNGGSDHSVAELGSGLLGEGEVSCIVGTAGVVAACTSTPVIDPKKRVMCWSYPLEGYWDILGITQTAASSLTWFRNTFDKDRSNEVFDEYSSMAEKVSPGSEGLVFLPYLMGERTPLWDSKARGVFFGLTIKHSKAHMVRAIMEGVSFSIKDCMKVIEELGVSFDGVNVMGGGSKSPVWRRIQSDVYGKKVMTLETQDTGSIGNLILTLLAMKEIRDPLEAARLVRRVETVDPDPARAEKYENLFGIYKRIYDRTHSMMAELEAYADE
jgi:xylulokinase